MEIFYIKSKQEYEVNGEKKTKWLDVGTLRINNGKKFIQLNMVPNETFYVFDPKPTNAKEPEVQVDPNF